MSKITYNISALRSENNGITLQKIDGSITIEALQGKIANTTTFMGFKAGKMLLTFGDEILDKSSTLLEAFADNQNPVLMTVQIVEGGSVVEHQ